MNGNQYPELYWNEGGHLRRGQFHILIFSKHNELPCPLFFPLCLPPSCSYAVTPVSPGSYASLPTWPAGRIDESLRIHTDHPNAPLLTCGIIGTMQTQETNDATHPE